MRLFILFLSFGLCLLCPIPLFAQVVISEVMWAGSNLSSSDEWLELANTSDATVDVSGWYLTYIKSTGVETTIVTFASGTMILPHQYFLIGSKHEPDSRLVREPDLFASSLVLPNTKLLITLRNSAGVVTDQADDGIGNPFAGANPSGTGAKASMERIDLLASGSFETNWRTATDAQGFDSGVSIFGSPGFANRTEETGTPDSQPPATPDPPQPVTPDPPQAGTPALCIDPLSIRISVQSGELKGVDHTTVNFEAIALSGSLTGLACRWSFSDGFSSDSCNPSPHAFTNPGITIVNLAVVNHCGNTLVQTLNVEVTPSASSSAASSVSGIPYDGSRVMIAGVMPNPKGADSGREWVEILNGEDRTVSLSGFELVLGETKQQRFRLSGSLDARGVLRIWNSEIKFKLKNTTETLRLISPNGDILSTVIWESPEEERVYLPTEIRGVTVRGTVTRVIDGDTLDLSIDPDAARALGKDIVRVRLLGIDAPEMMTDNGTTDPYSSEASEFLRALTEDKRVELEFDTELWDGYGRLLAYVYMDGGLQVQDQLLVNGMVRVMETFTFRKKELFLDLQERAGNSRIGLWSSDQASALTGAESIAKSIGAGRDAGSGVFAEIGNGSEAFQSIFISEIFPAPDAHATGAELSYEWIELGRAGSQQLSLSGWTLAVGKRSKVFDSRMSFGSGRYLIVSAADWKLQLPNAGGIIVLRSPDGLISADIAYPSLKSNQSYAWDAPAEAFCISTPTPLADNRCAGPVLPTKRASTAGKRTIAYAACYREQLRDGAAATIDLSGGAADDISASWLLFMTLPGAAMGVLGTVFGTRMGWIRVEK